MEGGRVNVQLGVVIWHDGSAAGSQRAAAIRAVGVGTLQRAVGWSHGSIHGVGVGIASPRGVGGQCAGIVGIPAWAAGSWDT